MQLNLNIHTCNSVLFQLQFEAFYTVNFLNAKWKAVPARNTLTGVMPNGYYKERHYAVRTHIQFEASTYQGLL